jgi:crotonobetainyl-CoA:carnitine CoA-transferase CaiB-like acyl-CoA transferase
MPEQSSRPLEGIVVLDVATILAGPVAATMLSDFGADVIKVEIPGRGDTTRQSGNIGDGLSLMWLQEGRNKRSVTLDLHKPKGQELLKRLVAKADAMIENFRPGTLERWGLGPDVLLKVNPRLILLRVSGYGQTGPYREKGALDRTATAFGGGTFVTGFEDGPPVRTCYAVADYMTAFVGAWSVTMALYWRDARGGQGQVIDLGLYEPIFRASEATVPAYHRISMIRKRSGNKNPGVVPASNFLAKDGQWVVLNANTDRLWKRLLTAMGREDLLGDPRFASVASRIQNEKEVYQAIEEWVASKTSDEVIAALDAAMVPAARINSIAELFADPHIAARENIVKLEDPRVGSLAVPGVIPKLSRTPGRIDHLGPNLGEHNEDIYCGLLGLTKTELEELKEQGVV